MVEALFQESDQIDIIAFKNALYLKLAQNYLRYRWVITYLFGAAPVAEQGFFDQESARTRAFLPKQRPWLCQ